MIIVRYPLASPKGAQKRKKAVFGMKSHFAWESLLQSFFVWKLSATKLCSFIGLTIRAKMISGGVVY